MSDMARLMHWSTVRVAWPTFWRAVPQDIEHELDDALAPGGLLVGQEEQQIDVGAGRQRAAAIAAGGHDGHALGVRRVDGAIDVLTA